MNLSLKNNSILNGMFILSLVSLLTTFLSYYFNFLIQSIFPSYAEYGNFTFFMTVLLVFNLVPGAISSSLSLTVTELNVNKEFKKLTMLYINMLGIYGVIGFLISVLILSLSGLINDYFKINNLTLIYLISAILFLQTVSSPVLSYLYGLLRFKSYALVIFLSIFLKIIFVLVFYKFDYGFYSIFYSLIGSIFLTFIIGNLLLVSKFDFTDKKLILGDTVKKVIFFSLPIFFITTGNSLLSQIDFLILKSKFSTIMSGQYALLGNIGKIFLFGSLIFFGAMGPQITNSYKSKQKYFEIMFFYLKIIIFLVICGLLVLGIFPKQFLDLFIYLSSYLGLSLQSLVLYYDILDYIPWYSVFIALVIFVNFLVIFLVATSTTRIFIGFILGLLLQFSLLSYYGESIFMAIICNIISTSLLLGYLIYEVYKKYESFNNSSSL